MRTLTALVCLLTIWSSPLMAEPAKPLTLERIFASPSINGPTPRMVKLSPDGTLLTSLRPRADDRDRFDLWATDTRTGAARMLVDSLKLGRGGELSEAEKMQRERARIGGTRGIVSYSWSPDSKSLLVPLDGELFMAALDGTASRLPLGGTDILDATVSPKGGYVSYVRDQNLFIIPTTGGQPLALTKDGGGTLSWGVAEFVAQEEMDRTKGAWWSPDDRRIAVARVDESKVDIVSRAAIGADGTKLFDQRYPRAGTNNAEVSLFLFTIGGDKSIKVDLGTNADIYLARVDWRPDGKSLLVQRQSRDQKRLDILVVDAATGHSSVLFSETSNTWLNLHENLRFLKNGELLWTSERDGYSHIYRGDGKQWIQLTSGPWMVKSIVGIDETAGSVSFVGNRSNPIEQHLYSVPLRGGTISQLTPAGWWHDVSMNMAATRAIIRRSNPSQPEQVFLADAKGKLISWIEENRLDARHPYAPYLASHVVPTFGTIMAADGTVLQTKLLMPKGAAGARHPVFVQVYGGPGAGRQVTAGWGGALQQYLVDRGWIVFSVDGRGTPDRGKAFEDQIYKAMGSVEVADQLTALAWLKQQPFVDPDRITVFGWSYGGYMTLKLLQAANGGYAAGVSGAPVTKWELYDTHYTERYMGDPRAVPEAYAAANVVPHAAKIRDPLLLIHGMADDNVVFDHTTALMAALQGNAQRFETMVYPGQTHRVAGPKVSVHLWETILAFLDRETARHPERK